MKLLFVQPMHFDEASYIGGGERFVVYLAQAVSRVWHKTRGPMSAGLPHDVSIVSFGPKRNRIKIQQNVFIDVLPVARAVSNRLDNTSDELSAFIHWADIVHIFQPFTACGEAAALIAFSMQKKVVLTDLGGSTSHTGVNAGMVHLSEAVVCISHFAARSLPAADPGKVTVIKGSFDDRRGLMRKACFPSAREGVCFVGRILPHKGIDVLIRALPDELPLIVCGRVYHQDYYQFLKAAAHRKNVVFVTDATDQDLERIYQNSAAIVLSSVYVDMYGNHYPAPELLGLVLLEAMSTGCYAVCNDVGGMPEFVGNDRCGAVYKDEFDLAALLRRVKESPGDFCEVEDQKFRAEWASDEFGLESVGQQYVKLYERISLQVDAGER
jgi:glycosyltransferase involved in cell wall biosynthesis